MPPVLRNATAFGELMGWNRLPLTGLQLQQGIEPRPSTVKVIEISVALCLKGMGLRAEAWSSTKPPTSWRPLCIRTRCRQTVVGLIRRMPEKMPDPYAYDPASQAKAQAKLAAEPQLAGPQCLWTRDPTPSSGRSSSIS